MLLAIAKWRNLLMQSLLNIYLVCRPDFNSDRLDLELATQGKSHLSYLSICMRDLATNSKSDSYDEERKQKTEFSGW